jgi:o-aminophenol oxidase
VVRRGLPERGEHTTQLAPNERGWKDVFRVPGNQMLRFMGKSDGVHGRFMYDMGMMRPFVVMPAQVLEFDHGGAHGSRGEGHTG